MFIDFVPEVTNKFWWVAIDRIGVLDAFNVDMHYQRFLANYASSLDLLVYLIYSS